MKIQNYNNFRINLKKNLIRNSSSTNQQHFIKIKRL